MEGTDRSRFCASCNRKVHNFSALTRNEAEQLLKSANGRLCARISFDASNRILLQPEQKRNTRASVLGNVARISIAGLAGLGSSTHSFAQTQNTGATSTSIAGPQSCSVKIRVTDATEVAVPKAQITITEQYGRNVVSQGQADTEGQYAETLPAGLYSIRVGSPGFQITTLNDVNVSCAESKELLLDAQLKVGVLMGQVVLVDNNPNNPLRRAFQKSNRLLRRALHLT